LYKTKKLEITVLYFPSCSRLCTRSLYR